MGFCRQFAQTGRCRFGEYCKFEHVFGGQGDTTARAREGRRHPSGNRIRAPYINHIAQFFQGYPAYHYDPNVSFMKQFYDMCRQFGWKREKDEDGNVEEDPERTVARARLQAAMVTQFNSTYGIGVNDLQAWQSLCRALEVERIPDNLEECRKIVMLTHVNICDLVDAPTLGKPELFDTERALADYTKRTGKFFSREKVPAGTLLRFLLRRILDPPTTKEEGGSRGSGPAVL